MPRLKNTPKTGGRQKGTPNKATAAKQAEVAATGLTPLDHMLEVMRDPRASNERRDFGVVMSKKQYHNQPESDTLSADEHKIVEGGREALCSLARTFDLWMVVGEGMKVLRAKADRIGGKKAFRRLLAKYRYDSLDNAVVTKLLKIMDRRCEVEAWRATLSEKQQREWSAPSTIYLHCPIFAKPKAERAPEAL